MHGVHCLFMRRAGPRMWCPPPPNTHRHVGCATPESAVEPQGVMLPMLGTNLPITVFGPYTNPYKSNGCHYNFTDPSPSNTDAWPFGMCSLKHAAEPWAPAFDAPGASGWVTCAALSDCRPGLLRWCSARRAACWPARPETYTHG